jgi:hypothetical protein
MGDIQKGLLRIRATLLGFVAALVLLGAASRAFAQAPGPMSAGHAHLTGPLSCQKCHEGGTGVPDNKCLGCHDHRDLRLRIEAGKGFHADPEVKSKPCKDCHAEHKEESPGTGNGRKTTVDWRPFGGQRNFAHQRAGWPLQGAHRFQKCEKCHDKKSPKTGLTTYLGLRGECTTCHGKENPHEFKDVRLTDCTICHGFDTRRVPNLGATKFDHDKTAFPLEGEHVKNECKQCHKEIKTFKVKERDFSNCTGCHEDSHKSVISINKKCTTCHSTKVKFPQTKFDHAKNTRFALHGQHFKNKCSECHKVNSKPEKPSMECEGCHQDFHHGRFGKEKCDGCHADGGPGWREMHFAHDAKTKFELTGKHQEIFCTGCHRPKEPKNFERFESVKCADCHRHQDAHCGQFGMENCERCHVRGGDRTSRFDHNATRFRLEGAHAKPSCERCHKPEKLGNSERCRETVKYTGLDPQCTTCHEDKLHKGELGKDCAKCHTGGRDFTSVVFDHNKDARFGLTGFHSIIQCETCHPKRKYKIDKSQCVECHKKDDVHEQRLGDDCAKCHETTGGTPKFDHNIHTAFDREGVHARIECARCHFLPAADSPERKNAPNKIMAAVAPPRAPIDLKFRASGKDCDSCHPDPHKVREKLECESCHGFEGWRAPPKNGYHERAGFALTGAHTVLQCGLCHSGGSKLLGKGEQCGSCHVQDDIHAGSFGKDCGRCHEQLGWLPVRFSHMETGFVLEGIHRTLDCRGCHGAGNYFIGRRCYNCHLTDYRNADWHQGEILEQSQLPTTKIGGYRDVMTGNIVASFDCGECHNQFSFGLSTYLKPSSQRSK